MIAQSQLLGDELEAAIDHAVSTNPSLNRPRLELAIGMFHTMFAAYADMNQKHFENGHPERQRPPRHTCDELLTSGQQLIDRSIGFVRQQNAVLSHQARVAHLAGSENGSVAPPTASVA